MEEVGKHCKSFYIRANRCSSLYEDILVFRGWKTEEINGIESELNSILVEKWKGKAVVLSFKARGAQMVSLTCGRPNTPTAAL